MKLIWLWTIFMVAGIGAGAFLLRRFVSYYVITPIVFAVRIERLLFNAIPEVVFWSFFLLIGLILAVNSLPIKSLFLTKPPQTGEKLESRSRQISKWIRTSEKSEYSKWMLARQLSSLAFDLLMYQERISLQDVRKFMRRNKSAIPDEVHDYILAGMDVPSFRHYSEMVSNYHQNSLTSPLDINPEIVIDFLETRIKTGGLD